MISISCLESKLLNNNNWYGRFQLAPFQKGEGLTVANALRRTLLAEKSNFFITWVDFYNAEIPYSVLTGMRESIFDILLNLKQVIFTSDKIRPNRNHFLNSPAGCEMVGGNNFQTQKVKYLSRYATLKKRLKVKSTINFLNLNFDSPGSREWLQAPRDEAVSLKMVGEDNFHIIPDGINNPTIEINQNLKNPKTNFRNLFCKNQILGKMINANHEVSSLVQLGIFNKSINVQDQFFDRSKYDLPGSSEWLKNPPRNTMEWNSNEKKISNATYIGYICAKGPTIIYAKNLKLPKGIKCVDPDKYIVTLADDGLFYLRFAVTTEIQKLPSMDTSNVSISINQGIKFNKVRLKTFPKILFHKEMQSCSSFKIISSSENQKPRFAYRGGLKKSNKQYFNNSQVNFRRSSSISLLSMKKQTEPNLYFLQKQRWPNVLAAKTARAFWPKNYDKPKCRDSKISFSSLKPTNFGLNSLKQKYVSFNQVIVKRPLRPLEKKIPTAGRVPVLSQIKLYNSKIQPVNHIQNLIKEQRLLITNDSIKQLNFQNTSILANIQKTCLLNIQIKHYYYKCGRFDRFLFDLIKPFKPTLKSTCYNEFHLKKKNLFYQSSNLKVLTGFYKTFKRQRYSSQLFINYQLFNPAVRKKRETYQLMKSRVTTHTSFKPTLYLQGNKSKQPASRDGRGNVQIDFLKNLIKKKHLINQLLSSASPKNNINGFFHGLPLEHDNVNLLEGYSLKNKSLSKWQKIFKSIKTNSIYDYLKKLSLNQARLTCLSPIKPIIETKIRSAARDGRGKKLIPTSVPKNILNTDVFVFSNLPENTKEFFSFVGTSSNILKVHKPYLIKFLTFGFSFQCSQNNILWFLKSYLLQHYNSLNFLKKNSVNIKYPSPFPKRELTNRLFLEEQNQASLTLVRQNGYNNLEAKPWSRPQLIELLFWMNENQKPKHDYHLREFYYEKIYGSITKKIDFFSSVNNLHKLTSSMAINGYILSHSLFYKKPNSACDFLINQSWIDLTKSHSAKWWGYFNSVRLSTTLRTKPLISIRQVSYKPVWILPCNFQQNPNLLRSWLDNINLPNSIQKKITKNKFLNVSCLAKESMKKTFNSIPINSVLLKPIYLHVSQIIYILKQTTKFRKNQLINPVFFNSFRKPASQDGGGNNKISFTDYYPKFSKVSNYLSNSLYEPCDRKTNQIKPNLRLSFLDQMRWIYPAYSSMLVDKNKQACYFYNLKDPLTTPYKKQLVKKNAIYRLALSHIWIFDSNFVFKNNLSYIRGREAALKNQASYLSEGCKQLYAKQFAIQSNSFYAPLHEMVGEFFYVPRKFVSCFLKPSMSFIHALNKVIPRNLTTINDFSRMDVIYKHLFFFRNRVARNKKTNSAFVSDNKQKRFKINNLYNEPYNINIYNSKISFNLRYTYPFKYTIFETFLPFQSMTDCSNKISEHRKNTIMFMAKEPKNKHFQATEKHKKEISVFNETMDSYPYIDFIQYNESFKIYTNLAYTCLKTSDPPLPKYYNFNKRHQKKSQDNNFKVAPFPISCFRVCGDFKHDRVFNESLFPPKMLFDSCDPRIIAGHNASVFNDYQTRRSAILNWKSFQKNQPLIKSFNHVPTHLSEGFKHIDAKLWNERNLWRSKRLLDKISKQSYFQSASARFFLIEQILADKMVSKIFTINHNNNFGPLGEMVGDNESLPSIFDSTYKWRIMNNPNFNDAFIIIPCIWSLNFQNNGLSLDFLSSIINRFYSWVPPMQNFFMDNVSKNLSKRSHSRSKEIIKNKLYWSRKSIATNKNIILTWIRPYRENSTKSQTFSKGYHEGNTYNSGSAYGFTPPKAMEGEMVGELSSVIPKSKLDRSLKKLAINFETSYYKNFLWNSRKITLRILNNAVLPLVANRKYSLSNFVPKKNYGITAFINTTMSKSVNYSPNFLASFIYNNKQKPHLYFDKNKNRNVWNHKNFDNSVFKNKTINKITKNWLHQTSFTNRLFEISNYQKSQRFYSIRHKILETTNFMCEKTYPTYINENQRQTATLKPNFLINQEVAERAKKPLSSFLPKSKEYLTRLDSNEIFTPGVFSKNNNINQTTRLDSINKWQKQEFDAFSESSFSFLHSKLTPFFYGSLKHFQASPDVLDLMKPKGETQEKDQFSTSPFVHFATSKSKQNENNENYLLSDNQMTPEKLAYFRRRHWTEKLTQGSKSSNESNISSITDLKVKSPLNSNLWWSSFFCRYSLYAISTQSDLFLQNLINLSGFKTISRDGFVFPQASSVVPLQTQLTGERWWGENTDANDNWTLNNNEINKNLANYPTPNQIFFEKMPFQSKQNDSYQFLTIKPSIKSYEKTMKKILKSQDSSLGVAKRRNYFVPGYNYNWQKAIHFTIFHGLKKKKSAARNSGADSNHKNSIRGLENYYSVRRLKNDLYCSVNPLRRRTNEKSLGIYHIKLATKLDQKFTTRSSFRQLDEKPVVKSWKSIIWKAEANIYFCFKYPIFIQNCNLPWQKSKHIFGISKHWSNKITIDFKPRCASLLFKWISSNFLSKTTNLNKGINRPHHLARDFSIIYTQLASSSSKTHQYLLYTQQFNNLISSVHLNIQNQASYGTVSYFTIKEGLNSIYKVNYIVESHVSESKPVYELESSNQNNKFLGFGTNLEKSHGLKKFEIIQRDSTTTDSLTISNFLNSSYSFSPNKTIRLGSFNELINSSINRSQMNHQNEYIQIDIWTNGEISPREALLNAFKKLFELFYNLSKYNCLKPIEI